MTWDRILRDSNTACISVCLCQVLSHVSIVNMKFGGEATWELVSVSGPSRDSTQLCCSTRWWFIRSCVLNVWCETWEEQGGCLFPSAARLWVWLHPFMMPPWVPGMRSDTRQKYERRTRLLVLFLLKFILLLTSRSWMLTQEHLILKSLSSETGSELWS